MKNFLPLLSTSLVILSALSLPFLAHAEEPLTQPLRDEHALMAKHIEIVDQLVASACSPDSELAQSKARTLVWTLKSQLMPHVEWEETVLYPALDTLSGFLCFPSTASMRHEHVIIHRGVEELEAMVEGDNLEPLSFGRRADQLLGVVKAHLEIEEQVLFPILDEWMSPHDFQAYILDRRPAEH